MKKIWLGVSVLLLLIACKKDNGLVEYDLIKHGLAITIMAPAEPEVSVTDMGIAKDVTIKKGDGYNIQIISSAASSNNVAKLIADKKAEVEAGPYFSQIILENEKGFVFEKKIDENNINYDFRVVKIQADIEYDFQTGLVGKFTKDDVMTMFEAVQTK